MWNAVCNSSQPVQKRWIQVEKKAGKGYLEENGEFIM